MTMQKIKRAVAGGFIQADMTGTGCFEVGRITRFDSDKIWFESANDGKEVWVQRHAAFKATRGEYELALHNAAREADANQEEADELEDATQPADDRMIPHREWLTHPDNLEGELEEGSDVEPEEEHESRSIVKPEYKQHYAKVKIGKRHTQDSGDELAIMLRGKDLDEVYEMTADILQVEAVDLYAKYEHLNPGQQRMVLGNRIRFAMKHAADDSEAIAG